MKKNDDLRDFSSYLLLEKGLSKNTSLGYIRDIRDFFSYADKEYSSITKKDINDYLCYLNDHYATGSIQRKIVSLRQYYLYLMKSNLIDHNVMDNIDLPKKPRKLPKVVTLKEVEMLLNSIDTATPIGKRNYVMVLLTLSSGMRVSEMVNASTNDFNVRAKKIKVIGKGNKERIIPLEQQTCDILEDYIQNERQELNIEDSKLIFLNKKGKPVSRENFYNILQKLVQSSGVKEHFTPHKLRHTFATTLLEGDADLRSIQELLGHSNIATTTIYTHVANEKIVDDYKRFFPRGDRKDF